MKALVLVAAVDRARGIGHEGGLPFSYPEDMKHFRAVTMGHTLIVGSATQRSIGKALPGRRTVVLTRAPAAEFPGCEVASSVEQALALARSTDEAPRVIGGGKVYAATLPFATELVLTLMDAELPADTHFPAWEGLGFRCVERRAGETPGLTFTRWLRD